MFNEHVHLHMMYRLIFRCEKSSCAPAAISLLSCSLKNGSAYLVYVNVTVVWMQCVDVMFVLQSTPHRVVLAKVRGYPLWPAKLISETTDKCDVRFFGQHDRSVCTGSLWSVHAASLMCVVPGLWYPNPASRSFLALLLPHHPRPSTGTLLCMNCASIVKILRPCIMKWVESSQPHQPRH